MQPLTYFIVIFCVIHQVKVSQSWDPVEIIKPWWWEYLSPGKNTENIEKYSIAKWGSHPDTITIDEYYQKFFGPLKIGTVLKLDKRTHRYIPPRVKGNFTNKDLLDLLWYSEVTRQNYCMVQAGIVDGWKKGIRDFCLGEDGHSICCDNMKCNCWSTSSRQCSCHPTQGVL